VIAGRSREQAGRRVLAIDADGQLDHLGRGDWVDRLRPDDAVIANDAATLPASLAGHHAATGQPLEARLATRESLRPDSIRRSVAVVFGAGDFRQPTEDRPPPPPLVAGDRLVLGPLRARVMGTIDHPRLVALQFAGSPLEVWTGLAAHGRPVQYAHQPQPLALWDVWTPVAAVPAAYEPPSAGFALTWQVLERLRRRGIPFATLTHAAGLSSTGDATLDARLPLDEPYQIPASTADLVRRTRRRGGRVVAVGTSVVRALESAAAGDGQVWPGAGLARIRIAAGTGLRVVDALVSGTHEPGSSHHDLLTAFLGPLRLAQIDAALAAGNYRTHEFGDTVFVERARPPARVRPDVEEAGRARTVSPAGPPVSPSLDRCQAL
jgi:S-adenosylmethionine:tRNA ribosyltransferase-isomerase